MTSLRIVTGLWLILVSLTACSGVSEKLGLGRNSPDEFAVVDRPPLAMPPDYSLQPPKPGAPRPQERSTSTHASAMLFGTTVPTAADRHTAAGAEVNSTTEKMLLETAGVTKSDPSIRDVVDREASQKIAGSEHLIDELLWWRKSEPSATTVDAEAEAERLKEVGEKGEPVNAGATPIIEKKKSGWLGL